MPSLEVVIGLILILLFYSLLATIIMELIAGFLSLRGKHLERALKNILSSSDRNETLFNDFVKSPLYMQLSGRAYGKKSAPSYMSSKSFREILFNIIERKREGTDLVTKIKNLPDQNLSSVLTQLLEEADFDLDTFKGKIEDWYDDVMDRASGWYARNVQKILLVLGLAIAIAFNVDTIAVFNNLVNASPDDLEQLAIIAERVNQTEATNNEIFEIINENLAEIQNPLGIGWTDDVIQNRDWSFWLLKALGWIITAICISKGTPFWFDLLNKIIRFRSSGNIPSTVVPKKGGGKKIPTMDRSKTDTNERDKEVIEKPVG